VKAAWRVKACQSYAKRVRQPSAPGSASHTSRADATTP
jgi:hypothetical protein